MELIRQAQGTESGGHGGGRAKPRQHNPTTTGA